MSGHSKWSTIKRKKGAADSQRAKVWSKLLRFIEVAARDGGGIIENNPTLATAVQKAKQASVPNDNINKAIKRGTGELQGENYEETSYEGYGPAGVALFVHCLTNNRNRSSQDVRSAFNGAGGKLAEPGAVAWMFEPRASSSFHLRTRRRTTSSWSLQTPGQKTCGRGRSRSRSSHRRAL